MKGVQLRVGYLPYPERLYRLIEIAIEKSLDFLGCAILVSFHARCDKLYSFLVRDRRFVSRIDYPLAKSLDDRYELDSEVTLSSLDLNEGDDFLFRYGRGADIEFDVKFESFIETDVACRILEGRGCGILEERRRFLDYYFENEDQEVFFSPIVQRKVKKEEYFGFDFDSFDEVVENRRLAESLEEVLKRYREATPMLPCF